MQRPVQIELSLLRQVTNYPGKYRFRKRSGRELYVRCNPCAINCYDTFNQLESLAIA